jgi:hypothetical protein
LQAFAYTVPTNGNAAGGPTTQGQPPALSAQQPVSGCCLLWAVRFISEL